MAKNKNICISEGCYKKKAPGKNECHACRSRKHRQKHPIKYAYDMLKKSARKRFITFRISLEYFSLLCKETGYVEKKGRLFDQYSIDRIIPELGYIEGNLQVITKRENTEKYHLMEKDLEWFPDEEKEDLPF